MIRPLPLPLLLLTAFTAAQQQSGPEQSASQQTAGQPPADRPPADRQPASRQPADQEPAGRPPAPAAMPEPAADGLRLHVELAAGTGRFELTTNNSPSRTGHTDAGYVSLTLELIGEHDTGGGIRLEGMRTDDDLFLDTGGIRSRGTDSDVFLFGTGLFGDGIETRVPLRLGLLARNLALKDLAADVSTEWQAVGLGFECEPDFALAHDGPVRWSLYGRFGFAFALATVSTAPATFDADSKMRSVDVGVGTRLQFGAGELGVGWLYRAVSFDESAAVNGARFAAIDGHFSGLIATFALRF
jgi:hypothetical protein